VKANTRIRIITCQSEARLHRARNLLLARTT
jgi:hypothetical protein